jgi:hypothetical protein
MRRALVALALIALAACGDDDEDARQDLPTENQMNDVSTATIVVFPDKFPNVAHKCLDTTGMWTTTDRILILIYNDHTCPGANLEQEMTVINGVPRAVVNTGASGGG